MISKVKILKSLKTPRGKIILFSGCFLFLLILQLNYLGFLLREKIIIQSTLDFSWFSDSIERFLHGFILGKDATFTYGPLFQIYHSIPSLVFNVPSYVSVVLSPIISFPVVFLLLLYISRCLSRDSLVQVIYVLFSFIFLGFIVVDGVTSIKMLTPIVFAFFLYKNIYEKKNLFKILMLSFLPTLIGLYIYNLFITTFLIEILAIGFYLFIKRRQLRDELPVVLVVPLTILYQLLFSILFTHSLDYFKSSIDSVSNYRYVMNLVWAYDRNNILLVFPVIALIFLIYLLKTNIIERKTSKYLIVFILASLIELIYVLSRSDAGHFLSAVYPSIIAIYSVIFFYYKKSNVMLILGLLLFVLIPFKANFYNNLAPKNILKVVSVIGDKPDFFSIYKLPQDYYYSNKEIKEIEKIVKVNEVFIYPYDSFILNIENKTFNSYGVGLYSYTNSFVEKRTVENFKNNPPEIIIFGIDTKGALNLDDIPNLGRNPIIARWILDNYRIVKKTPKYLVLSYDKNKQKKTNSNCNVLTLTINPLAKESVLQKIVNIIKPPIYYLGNVRLPYSPWTKDYLLFENIYDANEVAKLFEDSINKQTNIERKTNTNEIHITRISPFLHKREVKTFNKGEFTLKCGY